MALRSSDNSLVGICRRIAIPLSRTSIFIIYFWFGILKLFDASPANPLVAQLLERTLPFITFGHFIIIFGIFEMIIGILFLMPRLDKLAFTLFVIHMLTTIGPLVMLPAVTWSAPFVPTMDGQYIIKNLILLSLVVNVIASNYSRRGDQLLTLPSR